MLQIYWFLTFKKRDQALCDIVDIDCPTSRRKNIEQI